MYLTGHTTVYWVRGCQAMAAADCQVRQARPFFDLEPTVVFMSAESFQTVDIGMHQMEWHPRHCCLYSTLEVLTHYDIDLAFEFLPKATSTFVPPIRVLFRPIQYIRLPRERPQCRDLGMAFHLVRPHVQQG